MNWQPIETAPMDGTEVLLALPGYKRAMTGHYVDTVHLDHGKQTYARKYWSIGMTFSFGLKEPEPTHWMPLPELPQAPSGDAANPTQEI